MPLFWPERMLPFWAEIMSLDLAQNEDATGPRSGARRRPPATRNGLSATVMAPPPVFDSMSSHNESRRVIRIFLGSLVIGFIITGTTAWRIHTASSDRAGWQVETPAMRDAVAFSTANLAPAAARDLADKSPSAASVPPTTAAPSPDKEAVVHTPRQAVEGTITADSEPVRPLPTRPTNGVLALPVRHSRTAVYDIAAHTVYMPNGQTLEAHSGLGGKLDDPRFIRVKNKGPTPPNVYDLALREKPFHKVRAIRLIPVGGDSMFGRDGMLAHTYMRGGTGESNGCISFKDYPAFLRAFLKGEVDRLVVVPYISNVSWHSASAATGLQYLDTN